MVDFAQDEAAHIRVEHSRALWIYFLGVVGREGCFIKVGKSRKPRGVRLAQHRQPSLDGHVPDVVLLCEVKAASDADEGSVHAFFADLRCDGIGRETFRAEDRLIDYVRWLRDEHYVAVGEDSDEARDGMPCVESSVWLPRADRVKPRDRSVLPGMFPPFDLAPRIVTVDDFYTSPKIIEAARVAMGGIDLDPATHAQANRVVKASRFFTITTNGLQHEWGGRVWVNPPFSAWAKWAEKILREIDSGRVTQLCALAATRTITAKYFAPLLARCDALCVFRGRIPFWGGRAATPDDGHVVLYFGPDSRGFREAFAGLGTVLNSTRGAA